MASSKLYQSDASKPVARPLPDAPPPAAASEKSGRWRESIRELGLEAWLVGGAVRDAGLADRRLGDRRGGVRRTRRPSRARSSPRAWVGRCFFRATGPVRACFASPAAVRSTSRKSRADRSRRISNAATSPSTPLAVSLADGSLRDPFGGMADLARRRLRSGPRLESARRPASRAPGGAPLRDPRPRARPADPRRRACGGLRGLAGVAAERIGAELSRILESPRAAEAAAVGGARRDPRRRRSALPLPGARGRETRRAPCASLDDPATRAPARSGAPPDSARRAWRSRSAPKPGTLRTWLLGRRLPRRDAEDAARLAELVRRPPAPWPERKLARDAWRWIVEAGPLAREALHLLERSGRRSERRSRTVARLRRLRRTEAPAGRGRGRGRHGVARDPAGPQIGTLLSELAVEIASGQVKNRRDARNWLTGQVRKRVLGAIIALH